MTTNEPMTSSASTSTFCARPEPPDTLEVASTRIWQLCRGMGMTLSSELAIQRIRRELVGMLKEQVERGDRLERELKSALEEVRKLKGALCVERGHVRSAQRKLKQAGGTK